MARKILLLFLLVGGVVFLYFFTPARYYLSSEGFGKLKTWIEGFGVIAPLVFSSIYITAVIFALPGSVLTIGGGVLFGTLWGTCVNLVSATMGASIVFLLARYLGREFVAKRLKGKLLNLDEKIEKHGFFTVFYLRLIPLFPFNMLNYSLGLTRLRFRDYFFASLIGMAPGSFVYTSLGGVGRYIEWTNPKSWADYHVWGPFVLVIVLSLVGKKFIFSQKLRKTP